MHEISGATDEGLARYERALRLMQCLRNDPLAEADAAIAAGPRMPMAHALKAWLLLLGTEAAALEPARQAWQAARALPMNRREAGHVRAIGALLEGHWREAARMLEDLSIEFPRDALALQVGHQLDFFTGDARMLRDRIARALPAWQPEMPGFHSLLGMHAFGLEECHDYARAEAAGRRALELEPADAWAQHAVAHVMEMQARHEDGVAWMRSNVDAWSPDSFFAVHNWWHLALFHLDLGDTAEVLHLYDSRIDAANSGVVLEMIDCSAMLWRLALRGVEVGERWQRLADRWAPLAASGNYAFNDVHAMMAFVGAGRAALARELLDAQAAVMHAPGDNGELTHDVGHPVALALRSFGEGDYGRCVRLLRNVRRIAHRFGGSHAQRDLIDLTLIEAAGRAGECSLAAGLVAERAARRPSSPFTRLLLSRNNFARGRHARVTRAA
ncbi:MAG: tetratricopeptide repeat protein [Burkholderiales bacterium]|nr:tetratricopeptide repeat protein [Burkholderiales bacterium]